MPKTADGIEYNIYGHEMQFVEMVLQPNVVSYAEAGAMFYMQSGIEMETILGDGSDKTKGVFGKIAGMGKRAIAGEGIWMTSYTNNSSLVKRVAFAAPYPGKVIPINLPQVGEVLCQRDAFLCSSSNVSIGLSVTKISTGLFGGEGFFLQRLSGTGTGFVHAGGEIVTYDLPPEETIFVDTGCFIAIQSSVKYEIETIRSVKSMFFGGEGLFLARLTGPGRIWLQSAPYSRIERRMVEATMEHVKKNK